MSERSETGDPVLTEEQANWSMVKNALARMAQEQQDFFKKLDERLRVNDQLLIGRFDGVDTSLDLQRKSLDEYNAQLTALNQIVVGVRSSSNSSYDMAVSATRKIERVRKFLKVPDEVVDEPDTTEPVATAVTSDSPPRPVR